MLPAWKEKLLGQEFDNLGQLAQRVAVLNSQIQNMRRDTQFQKSTTMAEAYNPYSVDDSYEDDEEEEVAMAEWNWGNGAKSLGEEESKRAMTLTSQNRTSSLISCSRRGRSSCPIIILCCLPIS